MIPLTCITRRVLVPLALVAATACSSNATTSNDAANIVIVNVGILGSFTHPTITHAQLLYDGTVVDDESYSAPLGSISLGGSFGSGSGQHTVSIRIVAQTSTSVPYDISGFLQSTDLASHANQQVTLPDHTTTIGTGSSYTYTVTLN